MSIPRVVAADREFTALQQSDGISRIKLPPTILHRPRFRRSISWRFACTTFFGVMLGVTLLLSESKGSLTSWEKRAFNTVTILLSSLLSMALGSLPGLLGGILRWRLLASQGYTPLDVNLLVPTGSHGCSAAFYQSMHNHAERESDKSETIAALLFPGIPSHFSFWHARQLIRFGTYSTVLRTYDMGKEVATFHCNTHMANGPNLVNRTGYIGTHAISERPEELDLIAAEITARLPIMTIMAAQESLPRVLKESAGDGKPRAAITIVLEVKWGRVYGNLGGLVVGSHGHGWEDRRLWSRAARRDKGEDGFHELALGNDVRGTFPDGKNQ
ncbi:hypothetical protein B0T25DRAFT_572191 [Lasiosphaeria hispida]|uniref:Uncharacterized protein n=1 Tax=Lasiosphaeria hispida TaxID=260671 RepID=A0AAJ0HD29_9PEZI|nr:hypothetical protein B0T25DRAFT_572191 [Lasiosphaeria hispida]